jgi:hypothetical protein
MFFAGKAFFLGGCDNFPVFQQRGGGIMIECGDT